MVEVEMTKDIKDYETKLFGILTLRQLILVAIGLAYSIPLAIFLPLGSLMTRLVVGALAMTPVIMLGWISVYGMRLETFLIQVIRSSILTPTNRKYKVETPKECLHFDMQPHTEQQKKKIVKSAEYPAHK